MGERVLAKMMTFVDTLINGVNTEVKVYPKDNDDNDPIDITVERRRKRLSDLKVIDRQSLELLILADLHL